MTKLTKVETYKIFVNFLHHAHQLKATFLKTKKSYLLEKRKKQLNNKSNQRVLKEKEYKI